MSEERLGRIEAILTAIRTDIAALRADTKADAAALRAGSKDDLATLRTDAKTDLEALRADTKADLEALRADTKTDLEAAMAGVAKNVDLMLIGRQLRELSSLKDDITVVSALYQRLDNTMVRLINDVLTEVRAEHSRMDRPLNRVRALEDAQPER